MRIDPRYFRAPESPVLKADSLRAGRDLGWEPRISFGGLGVRLLALPQVSVFTDTGDALLTGQRRLVCSRCATEWTFARMTCASCRETGGSRLPIIADETRLPHLRVDACEVCHSYLVSVDLRRDPRAVPLVDEIAALPLGLAAADRGYTKITPNVMGL